MKKKIKSKSKNDLTVPFWIAIFLCLLGAGINSFLFHNSFFRALSKLNEESIATITFKYKTAQRKFLEHVVWDRLRQNSPVYNGDTIHTEELSEATIWFEDGTTLDLSENTMAQVFRHDDGTLSANLDEGSATVDSSENGQDFSLSAGSVQFSKKAGAKIAAEKSHGEQNVSLSVQKGSATLSDGSEISEGESLVADGNSITEPFIAV